MFTQPGHTSDNSNPLIIDTQTRVDNGENACVPYIFRFCKVIDKRRNIHEGKIKVLACLQKQGRITLGSNYDPDKDPVDVVLRHATTKDGPIGVSHHACTITRIDDPVRSQVKFLLQSSPTQTKSPDSVNKGTQLSITQVVWERDGKMKREKSNKLIGRLHQFKQVITIVASQETSTCIQVSHDGEIRDQIFISIPPDWNPQFEIMNYDIHADNWYWLPEDKVGDSPPPPAQIAVSSTAHQFTQESAKSLVPGDFLQLSQASAKEEESEKRVDSNFQNKLGEDPVMMFSQSEFSC